MFLPSACLIMGKEMLLQCLSLYKFMYIYPADIDAELLHVRSMDNRAVDIVVDLEEAVVGLTVCAVRACHLGALDAEHALVHSVLGLVSLAWVLELGSQ